MIESEEIIWSFSDWVSQNKANILTAYLATNTTLPLKNFPSTLPLTLLSSIGDKLSINANNNITVSNDVSKVKVSARVCFNYAQYNDTDGVPGLKRLWINNFAIGECITENRYFKGIAAPSIIIDTSTNKEIQLKASGNKDDVVSGSGQDTYITVEVLE